MRASRGACGRSTVDRLRHTPEIQEWMIAADADCCRTIGTCDVAECHPDSLMVCGERGIVISAQSGDLKRSSKHHASPPPRCQMPNWPSVSYGAPRLTTLGLERTEAESYLVDQGPQQPLAAPGRSCSPWPSSRCEIVSSADN